MAPARHASHHRVIEWKFVCNTFSHSTCTNPISTTRRVSRLISHLMTHQSSIITSQRKLNFSVCVRPHFVPGKTRLKTQKIHSHAVMLHLINLRFPFTETLNQIPPLFIYCNLFIFYILREPSSTVYRYSPQFRPTNQPSPPVHDHAPSIRKPQHPSTPPAAPEPVVPPPLPRHSARSRRS